MFVNVDLLLVRFSLCMLFPVDVSSVKKRCRVRLKVKGSIPILQIIRQVLISCFYNLDLSAGPVKSYTGQWVVHRSACCMPNLPHFIDPEGMES